MELTWSDKQRESLWRKTCVLPAPPQPPRITFFLPAFLVISKVGGVGAIELVSKNVDGEQLSYIWLAALCMSVDIFMSCPAVESLNDRTDQFNVTCFRLHAQLQPATCITTEPRVCSLWREAGMKAITGLFHFHKSIWVKPSTFPPLKKETVDGVH